MGWDYTVSTKPCPCGKGLIKETFGSNDWNQTSHHVEVLCSECKEKADKEAALKKEKYDIAKRKTEEAVLYFKEGYFEKFKDNFSHAKNKKDIWKIAHELGAEKSSLSTFYKNYKSKNEYINNLIRWDNLGCIIKSMNIKDKILDTLFKDAYTLIKPFDDEAHMYAYLHARGRI